MRSHCHGACCNLPRRLTLLLVAAFLVACGTMAALTAVVVQLSKELRTSEYGALVSTRTGGAVRTAGAMVLVDIVPFEVQVGLGRPAVQTVGTVGVHMQHS
jgi:hypothetical protein